MTSEPTAESDALPARVLLTISGAVPPTLDADVAAGRRPRADYREIAACLGADVVDVPTAIAATGRFGAVLHRFGGAGPLLAWYVFRHRHRFDAVLTDGEQVGLPLALLERLRGSLRLRHVMIVHLLTTRSKRLLMRAARLSGRIDRYVVYSTRQRDLMVELLDVDPDRICVTPFMVDTRFFDPASQDVPRRRMICSAGLERRDYPTLMQAVEHLDAEVVIAAASPWSRQRDSTAGAELPANVTIERLDLDELRSLYAESAFVVMPLVEVDFQAGITTILEAMSMGLPVVCSRTLGQTDTIVDGETGWYVPPGDVAALRTMIETLLDDPATVARCGAAARDWAVDHADVEVYARRLRSIVADAVADART